MARRLVALIADPVLVVVGLSVIVHLWAVVPSIRSGVTVVGDHRLGRAGRGGASVGGDPQGDVTDKLLVPGVGQVRTLGGTVELLVTIQVPFILDDHSLRTIGTSRIQQKCLTDRVSVWPLNPSQHRLRLPRIRFSIGRGIRWKLLLGSSGDTHFLKQGFTNFLVTDDTWMIPFHLVK